MMNEPSSILFEETSTEHDYLRRIGMLLCHGVSRLQGWKAEFEVTYGCLDVGDFFFTTFVSIPSLVQAYENGGYRV